MERVTFTETGVGLLFHGIDGSTLAQMGISARRATDGTVWVPPGAVDKHAVYAAFESAGLYSDYMVVVPGGVRYVFAWRQ